MWSSVAGNRKVCCNNADQHMIHDIEISPVHRARTGSTSVHARFRYFVSQLRMCLHYCQTSSVCWYPQSWTSCLRLTCQYPILRRNLLGQTNTGETQWVMVRVDTAVVTGQGVSLHHCCQCPPAPVMSVTLVKSVTANTISRGSFISIKQNNNLHPNMIKNMFQLNL